jgi:ABC-type microcin C transport system permease subunit YejB
LRDCKVRAPTAAEAAADQGHTFDKSAESTSKWRIVTFHLAAAVQAADTCTILTRAVNSFVDHMRRVLNTTQPAVGIVKLRQKLKKLAHKALSSFVAGLGSAGASQQRIMRLAYSLLLTIISVRE